MKHIAFIFFLLSGCAFAQQIPSYYFAARPVAGGGGGALTVISTNGFATTASATTLTCPLTGNVAGDTIVAFAVSGAAITLPGGYTLVTNAIDYVDTKMFFKTSDGSETTISITTGSASGAVVAFVARNVSATPLDKVVMRTAQGNPVVAGTTTTTSQADEIVFAGYGSALASGTPAFTSVDNGFVAYETNATLSAVNEIKCVFGWRIVSSTGTQVANFTKDGAGSGHDNAAIATFKK